MFLRMQEGFFESFGELDLDEGSASELKPICSNKPYVVLDHSDAWLLAVDPKDYENFDKRELFHSIANYYYSKGQFDMAYDVSKGVYNRNKKF